MSPPRDKPQTSQSAFAAALLDPAAALPAGLASSGGAAPLRRFAVYRNNVVAGLTKALGDAYPCVKRLVGDAFFDAMAGVFVREHPPQTPVMILYGEPFADWLDRFPPAAQVPYLADMARLEWARRSAYHAADAEPLSPQEFQRAVSGLSAGAVEALRFRAHPSLRLLRAAHPVFSIWSDLHGEPQTIPKGAQDIAVMRPRDIVVMRLLAPGEASFLAAVISGASLSRAAESGAEAAAKIGEEFDLPGCLSAMLEHGAVSATLGDRPQVDCGSGLPPSGGEAASN